MSTSIRDFIMAFVSKNFLVSYQKQHSELRKNGILEKSELLGEGSVIQRMLYQTKTISQIIAYIWLNADSNRLARQARDWFQNPTKNFDNDGGLPSLAKLMGASYEDQTQYGELLRAVFPDAADHNFYKFPIFNKHDIDNGIVIFNTDVNIFNGSIQDPDVNAPNMLTVVIAFPPCPKFDA